MKITQWLASKQIKLRLVNEEALKQKVKAVNQEKEARESYTRTSFHKQAEDMRQQKERSGRRALESSVKKEPVKNVKSYDPFRKYEDEYGFLYIYDDHFIQIGEHYCKKPTVRNSITHTFDIPANTTITSTKFVSDSGEVMRMNRQLTPQHFHSAGTYTITLNYDP